ncbi:hypothetical protein L1987_81124 [Smallanthus sonchifolius]|uniref:Uncharacterized protein n=1 Tax=Smallanthus sonchifolius TaxID=185202 RepID=A0ACB8YQ60_9ASTR|nr:hypothetical protein L1987_81124 [Smallanthus sonchifolius]
MGSIQRDSVIKNVLKDLCNSYGWSYGVFWSFDQQNEITIGQVAFTKNHQWMCLENHNRPQNSSYSIRDMFLNDSEFDCQFSCGIKTIAAIHVEPQGVVQFGSTKKIIETVGFVNLTKRMFQETVNCGMFEDAYIVGGAHNSVGPTCSSACPTQSCLLSSNSQPILLDHDQSDNWLHPNNLFPQCTSDVSNSTLISFNEPLVSKSRGLASWNSFPTQSNGQDLFDSLPNFGIPDDFDISQWIPPSPDQNQEGVFMNSEEKGGNLMPIVNESQHNFHYQKSNKQVGIDSTPLGSTKGLFSKFQINELLEGISGTSHAVSSTAKRRKTGNSLWEMSSLQTGLHKSEPALCMANGYGMNHVSMGSQAKNRVEPPKAAKKKAKPGTRPRPKDRQQILDRMAELRELIPNGNKMSIDSLLDRTIKHMLFLQSVAKHTDRIKQADQPKKNKDNDPNSNDATWAYELGNQTMACPLIVEDLSTPGQMLIEILCEERGFFLEMVDIIKGFGVIILKGVMEVRDKIWARFIVEAEGKRHVTRHEIFSALVQFLQATSLDDILVHSKIIKEKNRLIDGYQQSLVQLPGLGFFLNIRQSSSMLESGSATMADTIITSDAPSNSSQLNPPFRTICIVCQKQFSQYTCPRCNTRYCSLPCYKSHSLRCTESFMRDNVMEEMQQLEAGDDTKQKMLDILKRFHSEESAESLDDDGSADSALSEETIQKVMSGVQISFDDLSTDEKKHFQRAVASGELSKLIEPWEPWWLKPSARTISLSPEGTQRVQPITKQEQGPSDAAREVPPGPETALPPVNKLSSTEPSPLLAIHLVDILYSYCFTLRLYNGDWESDPMGSTMVVLSISFVLGQSGQPETVTEALSYCLEQTCSPAFRHMGGSQFGLGVLDDVASMLSLGGDGLVCGLCDLHRMMKAGLREVKTEKARNVKRTEMQRKLKSGERKVYFLMCWVHEQPQEVWSSLAGLAMAEKNATMDYIGNTKVSWKAQKTEERKGKVIIEEVL